MSRTFEVEVAQTLYWLVTIENDDEDLEEAQCLSLIHISEPTRPY